MEEKLTEALNAGKVPKLDPRKMKIKINLEPRKFIVLAEGNGSVTKEGTFVYQQMGVAAPTIYPCEQGLTNREWVKNFPGAASARTLVIGRSGEPTPEVENYFKYNRDEYRTSSPVRLARTGKNHETHGDLTRKNSNIWSVQWTKIELLYFR